MKRDDIDMSPAAEATRPLIQEYGALRIELRTLLQQHDSWKQLPAVLERMRQLREAVQATRALQPANP
jgi:hypothetical protein